MSSSYSFKSLNSQKNVFVIGAKIEAEVEIGTEGAKVTAPIETGLQYSRSKETSEENS